jgi:putative transposase
LARENDWGYTRILGELKKLGLGKISRTTVCNILRENQLDPKTDATKGTWADFLKAHAKSLWQCDFFSKHIVTTKGAIRQCFILAFVHIYSRKVWLSPCTFKPDAAWMKAQADTFLAHAKVQDLPAQVVLRDRDSKYTAPSFDDKLEAAGLRVTKVGFRAPNMNAYVERFVQAIQQECLDQFIIFGTEHFDHMCREYLEHYHTERPHQAVGNVALIASSAPRPSEGKVVCRERLGGVLRHYYREAA